MIKMIVSDLDGTLLNSKGTISNENLKAIEKARQHNIRFCVATGRNEQLVKEFIHPLSMEDPMILCNGAVIAHPFLTKRLLDLTLSEEDLKEITQYCDKEDITAMFYSSEAIIAYGNDNSRLDYFINRNKDLEEKLQSTVLQISEFAKIFDYKINKIVISEENKEKMNDLKKMLDGHPRLHHTSWSDHFIDISAKPASKGYALERLCQHFGYRLDEVCVIGDQKNDISMMSIAHCSACMENGVEEAKQIAKFITKSNDQDGLAYYINNEILPFIK